jgi:hypothetical protein
MSLSGEEETNGVLDDEERGSLVPFGAAVAV